MSEARQVDLEFCWGKVLASDPWFRLHFAFAPKELAPRILALHALFAMLDQALTMSEESLVLSQLGWWQAELSPGKIAVSAHPVLRALRESGALCRLAPEVFDALITQVIDQMGVTVLANVGELRTLCEKIGEPRVSAEFAIAAEPESALLPTGRWAGTGLSRIVCHVLPVERAALWFVPLDLQARYQSNSSEILQGEIERGVVLGSLAFLGESWFEEQTQAIAGICSDGGAPKASRHLLAFSLSEQLKLLRKIEDIQAGGTGDPGRWRFADFLRIWRSCRRMCQTGGRVV